MEGGVKYSGTSRLAGFSRCMVWNFLNYPNAGPNIFFQLRSSVLSPHTLLDRIALSGKREPSEQDGRQSDEAEEEGGSCDRF
jgi:hypothetical protein